MAEMIGRSRKLMLKVGLVMVVGINVKRLQRFSLGFGLESMERFEFGAAAKN
jgi:hypothetical protein